MMAMTLYEIAKPVFNGAMILGRLSAKDIDTLRRNIILSGKLDKEHMIMVRTADHHHIGTISKENDKYEWKSAEGQTYRVSPKNGTIRPTGERVRTKTVIEKERKEKELEQAALYGTLFV